MIYFYCPSLVTFNHHSYHSLQEVIQNCGFKSQPNQISHNNLISPITIASSSSIQQLPTMHKLPKSKKMEISTIDKDQIKDGDYTPDSDNLKRKRKSKQLQNRNVIPNIVRLILSYVQRRGKCQKVLTKLLQQQKCQYATLNRFFNFHKLIKQSQDNYVHQQSLAQLTRIYPQHLQVYCAEEQKCYRKITGCLIFHFLRHEAHVCVIQSKRMDKIKKKDHLSAITSLIDRIRLLLSH